MAIKRINKLYSVEKSIEKADLFYKNSNLLIDDIFKNFVSNHSTMKQFLLFLCFCSILSTLSCNNSETTTNNQQTTIQEINPPTPENNDTIAKIDSTVKDYDIHLIKTDDIYIFGKSVTEKHTYDFLANNADSISVKYNEIASNDVEYFFFGNSYISFNEKEFWDFMIEDKGIIKLGNYPIDISSVKGEIDYSYFYTSWDDTIDATYQDDVIVKIELIVRT
mgnify:CR=1 FL=1